MLMIVAIFWMIINLIGAQEILVFILSMKLGSHSMFPNFFIVMVTPELL